MPIHDASAADLAHRQGADASAPDVPDAANWPTIGIAAGLAGGAIDIIATLALQIAMGIPAIRVLQAIASGVLGKSAFIGGSTSAVTGLALHFVISILVGLAFAFAGRFPPIARRPWLSGAGLGVLVYMVMRYIVLPLSPVAFPISDKPGAVAVSVLFHVFAFGIPIALVTAASLSKRSIAGKRVERRRIAS